ncbi:hypothetical protein F4779DRAFT_597140 [Xylariaceae sp. FL0662B]|nr:hypothetical protein F4779DRAFT_597140 [Xylariaceae sp. FL0662B]
MHSIALAAVFSLLAGSTLGKTVTYDCSQTPQICLNTCWAVNCAGHPNPLHGGGGKADTRTSWGYKSGLCASTGWAWITPDNKYADSPDEYPLDGSKEGGWKYNNKVISLRCVPQAEQSIQGGQTSGIRSAPTSEAWRFRWTKISNLKNLGGTPKPNWCESAPTCTNDGHQFVPASDGTFVADDPNSWVRRAADGEPSPSNHIRWSDDGDTAELSVRIEGNNIVPVPFKA